MQIRSTGLDRTNIILDDINEVIRISDSRSELEFELSNRIPDSHDVGYYIEVLESDKHVGISTKAIKNYHIITIKERPNA